MCFLKIRKFQELINFIAPFNLKGAYFFDKLK